MSSTMVRGAFLSATVQDLLAKLSSPEFIDYITYSKLDLLYLAVLETTLCTLDGFLDDAEQKQFFSAEVQQWLDELEDAITDADDLFDDISYDSLQCKVENTQPDFEFEFNFRMRMMCTRLRDFAQEGEILGLQQTVSSRVSRVSHRMSSSSSVVNESVIVGRKDDKERLMNMLLLDSGTNDIGVVAILGTGGVGKTTLAQLVYNDKQVQEHFDLKVFISVLEDFDIIRVTQALLVSLTSSTYVASTTYKSYDLDGLRVRLKQELRGRRFLFVLDDLQNDNYSDWHGLVSPLTNGKSGSRVIVTTRQEKVAEVAHTFPIYRLEPLSNENCWTLLCKHAFGSEAFGGNKYLNLGAISWKIASKCGGLPLAAKTLGGLLRSKVDAKEWTGILNNDIWNLPNENIMLALLISYQYLSFHLKRCFAYCSIFPKGYPLDRKQLILLWMAEGFLEHSQGENALEEVGDDFFIELLSRSLLQQSNDDLGGEKFIMHDLVYDLATVVSGKSCCRLESGGSISKNVLHLSYNQEQYDIFKKFDVTCGFECLRSFLPIDLRWGSDCYLSSKVIDDLLPTLGTLRVLSLSNYRNITVLPDTIYILKQLRYLDLSNTKITSLPDTTCELYYLQTLILSSCWELAELPADFGKLINLRHLDISHTMIKETPLQIVGLENLQTLTTFVVGEQEVGLSVRELGKLPNLRGKMDIQNLHNIIDVNDVCDADLKSKKHIEELYLEWGTLAEDSPSKKDLYDMLQPPKNLKKLSISYYVGATFPSWLGDSSFSNMVYLSISSCVYCATLPPLGQLPSLEDLQITGMDRLETIGPEFYGTSGGDSNSQFQPFPSLKYLKFSNMSNWKEWLPFGSGKSPFPCLITLKLDHCPELRGHLPIHLASIERIEIEDCDSLLTTPPTMNWSSFVKYLDLHSQGSIEWSSRWNDSPCLLQHISICSSHTMVSLPKMILRTSCLQHLKLSYVSSLTAFPADGLPTSLQSLYIFDCKNLAFLPPETWSSYTSLVTLELSWCCDALTSFPLNGFPVLQMLSIQNCSSLESIFISESVSHGSSALQSLQVTHCDALRSLPQRMDSLVALESLTLTDLSSCCEGVCLPPKLRSIYIECVRMTMPVTEWGIQNLTALSDLHIGGDDIVNTLIKKQLLPISLVSLLITGVSRMKSLKGNGLQYLSSLKKLTFKSCSRLESLPKLPSSLKSLQLLYCPKLKSLPDRLPPYIETLEIEDCKRLESLPKGRLPSSLKLLSITYCRLLNARYKHQRGEHWSNIAHIPVIIVNDKVTI